MGQDAEEIKFGTKQIHDRLLQRISFVYKVIVTSWYWQIHVVLFFKTSLKTLNEINQDFFVENTAVPLYHETTWTKSLFYFNLVISEIIHPKCRRLPQIENGKHTFVHNPGWPAAICRVRYSCDAGYRLNGPEEVFCLYGTWSHQSPTCECMYNNCIILLFPLHNRLYLFA